MLDPIALASACVAISKIAISAATEVNTTIRKYAEVPRIVTSLEIHLKLISQCNARLDSFLRHEGNGFTEDEADTLKMSIDECENAILYIGKHLQPVESSNKFGAKIKHMWNEPSLKEAEERLKTQLNAQQALIQIVRL